MSSSMSMDRYLMDGDTALEHFRGHHGHLTLVAETLVEAEHTDEEVVVGLPFVR